MSDQTTRSLTDVLATLDPNGGRDFESLSAWFLRSDPEWTRRIARVWAWDDWPGRWGPDRGIDLVAATHDDQLIAVQCKHYRRETTITKQDVDSFLSESSRDQFAERVLISTTDRLSAGAKQVIDGQEKPVGVVLIDQLQAAAIDWAQFKTGPGTTRPSPKKPRPHQERALDALVHGFESETRGQLIMPCGTGKSLTSLWLGERLDCSRILVAAPTLALLRQLIRVWATEVDPDTAFLKVCSEQRDPKCELDAADLAPAELGGEVTTDPARIARFLSRDGRQVVFSTYDSVPQIATAMSMASTGRPFDLVICDEAHHCAGVASSSRKAILHEERIPALRRLFVTATPTIYGVGALQYARNAHAKIASMDDQALFGRVMHSLSFKQAIEEGLLCPYQVVVMPVTDQDVAELVKKRGLVTTDGEHVTDAYTLAAEIASLRLMKDYDCRRLVAFHPSVEQSRKFTADIENANDILQPEDRLGAFQAAHVDGYMTKVKRNQVLERFVAEDDQSHLLSNVKLLAEGVDVPGIDGIVFMDTHRSTAALVQGMGRALRPAPGKEIGTVLLPLLVQEGQSVDDALRYSEYGPVLEVLAALRSMDSEIRTTVDSVRIELGPHASRSGGTGRWVVDLPTEVGSKFAEAIEVAVVDVLDAKRAEPELEAIVTADSKTLQASGAVDWDDPRAVEIGLEHARDCRSKSYREPWLVDFDAGFDLKKWREVLYMRWEGEDGLSTEIKRDCAEVLNWLAIPKGKHRQVRREMAKLDPRDLAFTVEDWLGGWGVDHGDWEIDEAVRDGRLGYGSNLPAGAALDAIPKTWPRKQRVRLALEILKIGAQMAQSADPNRRSAISGFRAGLAEPGRSHELDAEATAEGASRSEFNAVAFGWEAGQRALEVVERERERRAQHQRKPGSAPKQKSRRRPGRQGVRS